ncbi:unnamed protein product [Amoebophrya sp. A25]|nr:unnamed protein product [Amoebophrya sp. A25]|eukprot:GSA25T00018062001.1
MAPATKSTTPRAVAPSPRTNTMMPRGAATTTPHGGATTPRLGMERPRPPGIPKLALPQLKGLVGPTMEASTLPMRDDSYLLHTTPRTERVDAFSARAMAEHTKAGFVGRGASSSSVSSCRDAPVLHQPGAASSSSSNSYFRYNINEESGARADPPRRLIVKSSNMKQYSGRGHGQHGYNQGKIRAAARPTWRREDHPAVSPRTVLGGGKITVSVSGEESPVFRKNWRREPLQLEARPCGEPTSARGVPLLRKRPLDAEKSSPRLFPGVTDRRDKFEAKLQSLYAEYAQAGELDAIHLPEMLQKLFKGNLSPTLLAEFKAGLADHLGETVAYLTDEGIFCALAHFILDHQPDAVQRTILLDYDVVDLKRRSVMATVSTGGRQQGLFVLNGRDMRRTEMTLRRMFLEYKKAQGGIVRSDELPTLLETVGIEDIMKDGYDSLLALFHEQDQQTGGSKSGSDVDEVDFQKFKRIVNHLTG